MDKPHSPRPPLLPALIWVDPEDDAKSDPLFVPDLDLGLWVHDHLFDSDSPLFVVDHVDIMEARIGFVWTNVELRRSGQFVAGTAQLGVPSPQKGDAWTRGAMVQQRREWFGHQAGWEGQPPDLLVTLSAPWCAVAPAVAVVALIDHELRHFGVKVDEDGEAIFDEETGRPQYRLLGHDVEEFVANVEHFGAWEGGLKRMKTAIRTKPLLDPKAIARIVPKPYVPPWRT